MSAPVLLVHAPGEEAQRISATLRSAGQAFVEAADGASAERALAPEVALVLCGERLADTDGLSLFRALRQRRGAQPLTFVILTADATVERAREALKAGVFDFLTTPVDPTELRALVRKVLNQDRLRRENRELLRQLGAPAITERLIGSSEAFRNAVELARTAARSEANILIRGESGTGKELLAELVHHESKRAGGPLVRVHCGAIPTPLLEAELFGHEAGAFTDAKRARKGRFEAAQGGTLFLDEVGEMQAELQVKLLRVLQERRLERLGGEGRQLELDVRLVAATHRDLESMIEDGSFRRDLYYRLNVIDVQLPPLRERPEDVPLLARYFLARYVERTGKPIQGFSPEALARLSQRSWPGNVRELENAIERAVVLGRGEWIEAEHLVTRHEEAAESGDRPHGRELARSLVRTRASLPEVEREMIRLALARSGANVARAARVLGLTRRTLHYRMQKHGLSRAE
ncbi:MAG: sigma-54-dependent Fis family transcriptional regulator [Planctomycetes bacterium]|nr:sigma-54-dependent Fis family transcriptional regulator [Planctomycetota bacterium]